MPRGERTRAQGEEERERRRDVRVGEARPRPVCELYAGGSSWRGHRVAAGDRRQPGFLRLQEDREPPRARGFFGASRRFGIEDVFVVRRFGVFGEALVDAEEALLGLPAARAMGSPKRRRRRSRARPESESRAGSRTSRPRGTARSAPAPCSRRPTPRSPSGRRGARSGTDALGPCGPRSPLAPAAPAAPAAPFGPCLPRSGCEHARLDLLGRGDQVALRGVRAAAHREHERQRRSDVGEAEMPSHLASGFGSVVPAGRVGCLSRRTRPTLTSEVRPELYGRRNCGFLPGRRRFAYPLDAAPTRPRGGRRDLPCIRRAVTAGAAPAVTARERRSTMPTRSGVRVAQRFDLDRLDLQVVPETVGAAASHRTFTIQCPPEPPIVVAASRPTSASPNHSMPFLGSTTEETVFVPGLVVDQFDSRRGLLRCCCCSRHLAWRLARYVPGGTASVPSVFVDVKVPSESLNAW